MSETMKSDFCITHFFNPVRFMRLLEIVETPEVNAEKMSSLRDFCKNELGKGIVNCNDTPDLLETVLVSMPCKSPCTRLWIEGCLSRSPMPVWSTVGNSQNRCLWIIRSDWY
jgi:hypothetical protein